MSRQTTFGRWFLGFLIMSVLAATEAVHGQASPPQASSGPDSLARFLRVYLGPPDPLEVMLRREFFGGPDTNTRISSATVRRADGGIEQIVVYVQGSMWSR
jgi:hypothetical protein